MENNRYFVKENSELRRDARHQLSGQWGMAVLLCFVSAIISGIPGAIPYIGGVISILIAGPLALGLISCFVRLVRNEEFRFENLFDGFKNFASALLLQILVGLFTFLWALLLIVPGIIAACSYAMAFYILYDNPEIGAMGALNASKEMMKGYKFKFFCLQLSFIGWGFLCILTLGIGFLWLIPYINTSLANFYQNLKENLTPAPGAGYESSLYV
jgi:uncharacterized membrane protein